MANDRNDRNDNRRPSRRPTSADDGQRPSFAPHEERNWRSYEPNIDRDSMGSGSRSRNDSESYIRGDERFESPTYYGRPNNPPRPRSFETSNENPSTRSSWRPSDQSNSKPAPRPYPSDEGLAEDMGWNFGFGQETIPSTQSDYGRDYSRGDLRGGSGSFGFGAGMPQANSVPAHRDTWNAASHNSTNQPAVRDYAGRGPRGYRRSDERIKEDASEMLARHPGVDASELEVEVNEGVVTLKGHVEERAQKRLAEDLVDRVNGVKDVRNELVVNLSLFQRAKEFFGGAAETSVPAKPDSKH